MTKYQDLMQSLRKGIVKPLYLFFGEEEFLVREAVDLIAAKAVDPSGRDFNLTILYAKETSASELVGLCETIPFLSEKRLVIVKGIEAFKASDLEHLIRYCGNPSPTTCLVLASGQDKYEKKTVIAAVEEQGVVTRFFALLEREISPWIEAWVRLRGLSIEPAAVQHLVQTLGNDLQKISNELEKVHIFIRDRKTVTFDDVKAVAGDFREYTSFDFAGALGQKNTEKAFLILARLMQEGESPVGLLGAVAWNFRRLTTAKSLEAAGVAADDAMKRLRPPVIFHQAGHFKSQMRSYGLEELRGVYSVLLDADRALKSSGLSGRLVLERMILRLCGAG